MKKILLQLDTDSQPSVFDSVVAVDSQIDVLFRHHGVTPSNVVGLVHGCIFTRGPADLKNTAIFIGGSDTTAGEELLKTISKSFFGPMKVSVMMDSNGSNTTAAAAVIAAGRHIELSKSNAVILGGTGPVGQRIARLVIQQGAKATVCSRTIERAKAACQKIAFQTNQVDETSLIPAQVDSDEETLAAIENADVIFAAGAAGIELLSKSSQQKTPAKVMIDLNAVPPAGISGIEVTDKAIEHEGKICYGAIGVGGTKMKIHRAVLHQLFESNEQVFDAEQIFEVGQSLE